jgi:hypothetical protein
MCVCRHGSLDNKTLCAITHNRGGKGSKEEHFRAGGRKNECHLLLSTCRTHMELLMMLAPRTGNIKRELNIISLPTEHGLVYPSGGSLVSFIQKLRSQLRKQRQMGEHRHGGEWNGLVIILEFRAIRPVLTNVHWSLTDVYVWILSSMIMKV